VSKKAVFFFLLHSFAEAQKDADKHVGTLKINVLCNVAVLFKIPGYYSKYGPMKHKFVVVPAFRQFDFGRRQYLW